MNAIQSNSPKTKHARIVPGVFEYSRIMESDLVRLGRRSVFVLWKIVDNIGFDGE